LAETSSEDYEVAIAEIRDAPDRSAGIVASALLETIVQESILMRLIPMSNTHQNSLFGGESSFATFSAKIDLGFSLGLYGPKTKSDLSLIRKIRNQFAHHIGRTFGHPEIIKFCSNITDYRTSIMMGPPEVEGFYKKFPEIEHRWRFLMATTQIGLGLMKEAHENARVPPSPSFLP
jgi:hypothetical protein